MRWTRCHSHRYVFASASNALMCWHHAMAGEPRWKMVIVGRDAGHGSAPKMNSADSGKPLAGLMTTISTKLLHSRMKMEFIRVQKTGALELELLLPLAMQ
jgi:hypothetical protein